MIYILIDKSFQFLLKNEYKLVTEYRALARRDAKKHLQNPNWRCQYPEIRIYT